MKPSQFIKLFASHQNISELEKVLFRYINENGDDIEQLKAITKPTEMSNLMRINEFEMECRLATDALEKWRSER